MNDLTLFQSLVPPVHGGFVRDLIQRQILNYLKSEWNQIVDSIKSGDFTQLETILNKVSDIISDALDNRIRPVTITNWLKSTAALYGDWSTSAQIRLGSTGSTSQILLSEEVITSKDYLAKVEAVFTPVVGSVTNKPQEQEGIATVITIATFVLKLVQFVRNRR